MKPKIQDVAKLAKVSPTTVSRVLNNRGYISKETRKKVEKAMKELNYFPNDIARSLFNKRTNLIGLILPTTSNPFFGELTFNIENICNSFGYKVLICNSLNDIEKEKKYVEMLMRNQVDGIIVGTHNDGILDYNRENMPVIAIDRNLSESIPIISSDNYHGGKIATELLISKGCKNIINMDGPWELETPAKLRRKAYEEIMKKNNMTPITYEIHETFNIQSQHEISRKILNKHPEVDGVFASNDMFAASFIHEAKRFGKDIPKDVKVIGYDGTETCRAFLPELTTIQQPIKLIAKTAVEMLIKEIEGEFNNSPTRVCLPINLIEGRTT